MKFFKKHFEERIVAASNQVFGNSPTRWSDCIPRVATGGSKWYDAIHCGVLKWAFNQQWTYLDSSDVYARNYVRCVKYM